MGKAMQPAERFADCADWLHAAAREKTGLSDFGPPDYRVGLTVLLDALDAMAREGRLSAAGRSIVHGALIGTLVARLYTQEGWRRNPHYREVGIRRPLIIIGVPRTGTTALHKLLSVDPQFQGVEFWLSATPMPRPPRATWPQIPEYQGCVAGLQAMLAVMPDFAAVHDMTADTVDECLNVLQQSFVSNMFASTFDVPDYRSWWYEQDEGPSYRRYADVLRLVGIDEPGKSWLLKNPGHIWGIDHLLSVFPDACIVQTHRDPAQAIPSLCSVLRMVQGPALGNGVQSERLGPIETEKWLRAIRRTEAARVRYPERFHDVRHSDFHRDPIGVVRGIYRRFDIPLSADSESRMRDWLANQPPEQKGGHRYTAEEFGVTAGQLRRDFADYIARYRLTESG